ncbi:MAG: MBL fold metallo-hydrolase [Deltaproteobacteria bacterium HGW-Deltaproteobacteria-15]|jgi:glyoxylase-like metal-dependent hydrolase (beta-lactamase superfamily II)|nr:MAG: MBL fold metallo-hydrolase [Deltaproteobacteria bacterium HGW-Deltaproteobacteria-15]
MNPILIPLRQKSPTLKEFMGSWVCGREPNIITDVGPASSIEGLVEDLSALGMKSIDYVLITHIHLDHAGGLAEFLGHFPMAKVICHAKGIRHLVDPSRLWDASLKTLGDLALVYGQARPVDAKKIIPHTDCDVPGLRVIETPGHAVHHLSFVYQGNLFAGEAAGVYYHLETREYLRQATPPPFFMKETLDSIDRLLDLEDQPICYAHIARASSSKAMLHRARNQILFWKIVLEREISKSTEDLVQRCIREILRSDPELRAFDIMTPAEQEREMSFLSTAVKGFLEYLGKEVRSKQ